MVFTDLVIPELIALSSKWIVWGSWLDTGWQLNGRNKNIKMSKNHFFAWMGTYCWIYYFSEKSDTKWTTPELKASEKRSGVFCCLKCYIWMVKNCKKTFCVSISSWNRAISEAKNRDVANFQHSNADKNILSWDAYVKISTKTSHQQKNRNWSLTHN